MDKKKRDLFFLITTIFALIFATYILYETVFEQIISQSQGYFYAGVFGFILLLVFLLCNLFTKLIATSTNIQNTLAWRITALVILGLICIFFVVTRMRYTSQLSGVESNIYKTALSIIEGNVSQNKDLIKDSLANSANFTYAFLISILFRIFGDSSELFLWTNVIVYAICLILIYRVTMLISDRVCGLVAAFLATFIPSQTFSVYVYDSNPIFTLIVLIFLDIFVHLFSTYNNSNDSEDDNEENIAVGAIVYTVLLAVITGFLLHIEFVMIILVILLVVSAFLTHRKKALMILVGLSAGLFIFAILTFVKSVMLEEDFGTIITENVANFDPTFDISEGKTISGGEIYSRFVDAIAIQDDSVEATYFFLYSADGQAAFTELFKSWILVENQLIYMFLIIMFISCAIIALKENFVDVLPINMLLIVATLQFLFSQCRDLNKHYYISLLVVAFGVSVHYLYLNHHPEMITRISTLDAIERTGRQQPILPKKDVAAVETLTEEDFVKRARALVFIGNDEDLYQKIKNEEHRKAIAEGNRHVIEKSFDDYDEDYFLDDGEDDIENKKDVQAMNVNLPAWKQKPEKFGDENMFFDEDEEDVYEDGSDVYDDSDSLDEEGQLISVSELTGANVKSKDEIVEPVVEVVKRKSKETKKKEDKKKEDKKKTISTATNTLNNGKAVRRVKAVGVVNQENDEEIKKYLANKDSKKNESKEIPNPLPTPKKKAHKNIDYSVKEMPKKNNSSDGGWDYAYDIDDDDDWDV